MSIPYAYCSNNKNLRKKIKINDHLVVAVICYADNVIQLSLSLNHEISIYNS